MGKTLDRNEARVFVEFGGPLDFYSYFGETVESVRKRLPEGSESRGDFEQYWEWAMDAIGLSGVGSAVDESGGPHVAFHYCGDSAATPTFFFKQDNNGDTTVVSFEKPFLSPERTIHEACCVDIVTHTRADRNWFIQNGVQVREFA